ncbi:FecR family protein [Candidatus Methylospira mobilis]|nr:FecR family protein [Candidatus Methylospira mobilis]WNV06129.1 FecR family protein [Candidatus Methylospira mobilis]
MEETISNEAIEWFSKLHSGDAVPEDFVHFEEWRQLNPSHAEAYADVERFWAWLDTPAKRVFEREDAQSAASAQITALTRKPALSAPRFAGGRTRRRALAGFSLAAAVLMFTCLPGFFHFWNSDYHTGWGERRELVTEDGSRITLNTHSAISVAFSSQQRVIKLSEGEAYFQVAHNSARPFLVVTDYGVTQVTGTAFDVYKQSGQMTVTVSEGKVKVYREGARGQAIELTAGLQTTLNMYGAGPVLHTDARQVSAWKNGLLVFNQQSLASVVTELNRYFPGKIMIADPRIRQRIVSGAFDLAYPQDILSALEKNLELRSLSISRALTMLYQPGF